MSYRNPTQHIDRQSGQIEQNLQKTLSGIGTKLVSDVNKIHEENARQVRAIKAAADKRVAKSQYSIEQTESKNPTTDFSNLQPELSRMNAILLKDPAKRTYEEKSFVTSMEGMGDSMANMLKNTAMSQEATIDLFNKKIGTMGSVDPKQDPKLYAKLSVLANQTEGYTKAVYTTKNGVVKPSLEVWGMYEGEMTNLGSVMNDNTSTTQMPPIIPDITKEMTEAINVVMNTNDFVSKFGKYIKEKGAFVGEDGKSKGYKVPEDYFSGLLKDEAKKILAGLSPRDKISLYNNILDKDKGADFDYNDTLEGENSDDKNKKIEDALVSSLMRQTKATNDIFAKTNIVKKDTPTPPKKITAADKLYNDQVELADTSIKDMDELMKTPLKEIGNRKFTMDEQGAFIQVINRHRSKADGKVQTMEDIKADFIREEGKDAWDEGSYTAELGYVKESGGKKIIVQLPVGSYEQKTETLVDLLYPNLKTTRRNKMLNIIRGNEGEITLNRSELP